MRIIAFILLFHAISYGQEYDMKVIPFHIDSINPNAGNITLFQDRLLISVILPGDISTLIDMNLQCEDIGYLDIENFVFSFDPFAILKDNLFLYAKDREIKNNLKIKAVDANMNEILNESYQNNRDYAFPSGSIAAGEHLFLASIAEFDDDDMRIANVKKIDADGVLIWSKEIGLFDDRSVIWEMDSNNNDELFLSIEVNELGIGTGVFHHLMKISESGNTLWDFIVPEELELGLSNYKLAVLENENIVMNSTNDRRDSLGYGPDGLYPYPPKLTWVSPDGEFIKDTLLNSEFKNFVKLNDIKNGAGDYFYGFGNQRDSNTEEYYAWLFKMSFEGEIIWSKLYQHPDLVGFIHTAKDIIEFENGDIIVLAQAIKAGDQLKTLLIRVNQYGCFGEEDCPDQLIFTDTHDLDISDEVHIYPNPTSQSIIIDSDCGGQLALFDMQGRKLLETQKQQGEDQIDISDLPNGTISYRLVCKDGVAVGTFIKI